MWLAQTIELIVQRRRFVILNTVSVTLVAILVSLVLPKHYRATATILPPDNEAKYNGLMSISLSQVAQAATSFSLPIMATPSDLYASIVKSDTILVRVVDKLGLVPEYDTRTRWQAVSSLRDDLSVKVEAQGIIRIEVEARRPELAADIANAMVDYLDSFNRELQQQKGRAYSTFLERRLKETDSSIAAAGEALRSFQSKYQAVSLDLQAQALITTLAELKGKLTANEIELQVMHSSLAPTHPSVIAKQMEVDETRRKLLGMEGNAQTRTDSIISALDLPLSVIPDLSLRYSVLVRNLKIQEVTYELLSQQMEMYRVQAQRDTPTISILDRARPPESASRPKKRLIALVAFVLSLLVGSGYVVFNASPSVIAGSDNEVWARMKRLLGEIRRKPLG